MVRSIRRCFFKVCLLCLLAADSLALGDETEPIDFAHDVVPILKKHCIQCHGGGESKGGLSINSRALLLDAEVVMIGKSEESRLIKLVTSDSKKEQMPPKEKSRLSANDVKVLRRWIDEGLRWEQGFTFSEKTYEPPLLPRRPNLPPPIDGRTNPIDRIIDAYLAEREIKRPNLLDDGEFIRRTYLDLVGLPPTPDELTSFILDRQPNKHERLVGTLLADDQRYAEHWMTFWSDLLRNAYSGTGYIDNGRKQITGWLYAALLENKPYDQFVQELIAPTPDSEGFIRGIKWRGNVNASQTRDVQFAQNISQVFLGINMKCASCHDSFIDRWTLSEAYGLAAIYATGPLEIFRCDKPTGKTSTPGWIFPELGDIDASAAQPERLKQLAALMTHPKNGRVTRTIVNRIWCQMMGHGIVHPVDAMHTAPWSADLLDYLAVELVDKKYDLKQVIKLIATSQAYRSRAFVAKEEPGVETYVYSGPVLKRMSAEQFLDSIWLITNTWPKPDGRAFKIDGRNQGGQLAAVLKAHGQTDWKERHLRAVFTPLTTLQASLGRPNREQVVTSRPDLLTTLEAINLANGAELSETLSRGAQKVLSVHGKSTDAMIEWLYRRALSRKPTHAELAVAREIVGQPPTQQTVEDVLWTVFMLPEFQFIR